MFRYCCRTDYHDKPEAVGYVAASGGRGPGVIFDALFSVVAFNAFAASLADCDGRVLGIEVSSVVSTLATVEGVISPIISPFLGGIADTTPHRKPLLGFVFAIVASTLVLQGIFFLSEDTERIDPSSDSGEPLARPLLYSDGALIGLAIVVLINVVTYELAALLTVSYSPELTKDETEQMGFIADSYAANNGSQLFFLVIVIGISLVAGLNSFEQGAVGAFVCAAYSSALFYWGFFKLGSRREIDPELNKSCCGTRQLFNAFLHMVKNYPECLKYLISWGFSAAAVTSSVALATTYFQLYLGYSGTNVSILLGIALLCSVPGSILSRVWHKKFGIPVKKLYIAVNVLYAATFLLAPVTLVSERITPGNATLSIFGRCENVTANAAVGFSAPDQVFYFALLFVFFNGILLGHIYPLNTQFYALLIPGGEENTYYGMKVTTSKVLTWLPPLVFTVVSEVYNGDLRFALLANGFMFLAGAVVAFFIDVEKGRAEIKDTLQFRQGAYRSYTEGLEPTKLI